MQLTLTDCYLFHTVRSLTEGGDTYTTMQQLFGRYKNDSGRDYDRFQRDLEHAQSSHLLDCEQERVYLPLQKCCEDMAASLLAEMLQMPVTPLGHIPETMNVDGLTLCEEQREAVQLALSNRLALILGGAGTGKTTLIRAMLEASACDTRDVLLCAPTGKAAQNLREKTGREAVTIHSALGIRTALDFPCVLGSGKRLIVVDEASMLTLEMLTGLLLAANRDCRLVLLGDPNQLQAVGSGNVLPDLLQMGVPRITLSCIHRQVWQDSALRWNVAHFTDLKTHEDCHFDNSFQCVELPAELRLEEQLVKEAAWRYRAGEHVMVLSPYHTRTSFSVDRLNHVLQKKLSPSDARCLVTEAKKLFRDGDPVMFVKNDRNRDYCNGDIGMLRLDKSGRDYVELPHGRQVELGSTARCQLELAYALTVHKAQGSEFDTVLLPIADGMTMLQRNLLYTAISRARKQVLLFGSQTALDRALRTTAKPRRSALVAKTQAFRMRYAG